MKSVTWTNGQRVVGRIPVKLVAGAAAAVVPLAVGADGCAEVARDQELGFGGPGEQVFAVVYRKVRFRLWSSRTVDSMFLEPRNRWKSRRDRRGVDAGEADDQGDLIEVTLVDEGWVDASDDEDGDESDDEDKNPPSIIRASQKSQDIFSVIECILITMDRLGGLRKIGCAGVGWMNETEHEP